MPTLNYDADSSVVIDLEDGVRAHITRVSPDIARLSLERPGAGRVPAETSGLRLLCVGHVARPCAGEWFITHSARYTLVWEATGACALSIVPCRLQRIRVGEAEPI